MIFAKRGVTSAQKFQLWFKRRVLRQPWMMEEFASPILQESLLLDKARCDAYREAIHRTVKPGEWSWTSARAPASFPSSRCKPARDTFTQSR
jgi:hypothetical protein